MTGYLAGLGLGIALGFGVCLVTACFRRVRPRQERGASGTTGVAAR